MSEGLHHHFYVSLVLERKKETTENRSTTFHNKKLVNSSKMNDTGDKNNKFTPAFVGALVGALSLVNVQKLSPSSCQTPTSPDTCQECQNNQTLVMRERERRKGMETEMKRREKEQKESEERSIKRKRKKERMNE
jgi:hypothetical protein